MYYSYTPRYDELDYLYQKYLQGTDKRLNFFFDVKNGISGDTDYIDGNKFCSLREDNKLQHLVELVTAIINTIAYIKGRYATYDEEACKRLRFFYFCETGKSSYHKGIDMAYKSNRGISDYLQRDERNELRGNIVLNAIQMLNGIMNLIPNTFFFAGTYSEYDFIPYVVFKRYFEDKDIGVIFSSDKDMYQIQSYCDKFEQLERLTSHNNNVDWHPGRMFVNNENYVVRFMHALYKKEDFSISDSQMNFIRNNFSFIRGILGDPGDGIAGVPGVGMGTLMKFLDTIIDLTLPRDKYNHTISHMTFNRFDYKYDESIFDLEKIKELLSEEKVVNPKTGKMVKRKPVPKALQSIVSPKGIERICRNIALMDYDVMNNRRTKDMEDIDAIYNNTNKFKTVDEAYKFLNETKLWQQCCLYRPYIIF